MHAEIGPSDGSLAERSTRVAGAPRLSRPAAQLADRLARARALSRGDQLAGHQVELLRPHRGLAGDREHAVALGRRAAPRRRSPGPRPRSQTLLHARERASPARAPRSAPRAPPTSGRGARRLTRRAPPAGSCPARSRRRVTAASPAPGTCARSVVAITLCPPRRELARRAARGARRRARSSRRRAASAACGRARARARRARRAAAPAARGAARPGSRTTRSSRPSRRSASSSRWGPWPEKPRSRSPARRSCSSATNSSSSAARERGRYSSAASPLQAELRGALGERLGEQRDRLGAVARAARARGARARDPSAASVAREARPGADPREQGVALREHARVLAAGRARASGQSAATSWSRWARRSAGGPLTQLEPVGQEDAQQRALLDVEQALDGRAVGGHALDGCGPAAAEADASARAAGRRRARLHDDARRLRAEAHQLALVARARRARRCSRSRAPRAGSTCRRRWARARPSGPSPSCASARA